MKKIGYMLSIICTYGYFPDVASSSSGGSAGRLFGVARSAKKPEKRDCDRCPMLMRVGDSFCWDAIAPVLCSLQVRERLQQVSLHLEGIVECAKPFNLYDAIFDVEQKRKIIQGYTAGLVRMLKLWKSLGGSPDDFCRFYLPHVFFQGGYTVFEIDTDRVEHGVKIELVLNVQDMHRKQVADPIYGQDTLFVTRRLIEHFDFMLLQRAYDMDNLCLSNMVKVVKLSEKIGSRHSEEALRALNLLEPRCVLCRGREFERLF